MIVSLTAEGSKCKIIVNGTPTTLYPNLSDICPIYKIDDTVSIYIKGWGSSPYLDVPIANLTIGGVGITSQTVFDTQVAAVFPNAGGSAITTLTTTGTSGAATLVANTLNIPVYGTSLMGAIGDLISFSALNTPSNISAVGTGYLLGSQGTSTLPAWLQAASLNTSLTTPLVNGGTGTTSTATIQASSNASATTGADIIFLNKPGTEPMRILNNGNIGVGVTSTSFNSRLHIKGASSSPGNTILITTNSFTASSAGSVLVFGHAATSGNTYATIENLTSGGTVGGNLVIQPSSGGNVGIGVTSPTAILHLKASTATANTASLKMDAGTRQTSGENGTINYETGKFVMQSDGLELGGHLIFKTNATYDIGASGGNKPRDLYLAGGAVIGGVIYLSGDLSMNGIALKSTISNLLQFGGTTSSFPALKRSTTTLQAVLADDSGFAAIQTLYERFGAGTPEAAITAPIGAIYHRTDGGAGTSNYKKESGAGNTGWVAF